MNGMQSFCRFNILPWLKLLLWPSPLMAMAKYYDISLSTNYRAASVACRDNVQCVCGGEYFSGFCSLLSICLTYMWGCKCILLRDIFGLVSVAAENLTGVCLAIKHSFEALSLFLYMNNWSTISIGRQHACFFSFWWIGPDEHCLWCVRCCPSSKRQRGWYRGMCGPSLLTAWLCSWSC